MRITASDACAPDTRGDYDDREPPSHPEVDASNSPLGEPLETVEDYYDDDDGPMMVEDGGMNMLMVKIPSTLMTKWIAKDEGIQLATIRVYHPTPANGHQQVIKVILPPDKDEEQKGPEEYDMIMQPENDAAPINEYIYAERDADYVASLHESPGSGKAAGKAKATPHGAPEPKRMKHVALSGRVGRHCMLRAVFSDRLRQRIKACSIEANKPKRQTIYLGHGLRPPLDARGARKTPFISTAACNKAKGATDRMTRAPQHVVLDMLFELFKERPRWSTRQLRERTKQPEVYLKELLPGIASLNRFGEHLGMWELTSNYGDSQRSAPGVPSPSGQADVSGLRPDGAEEDNDDSDLEEVI